MSVAVSRLREGLLKRENQTLGESATNNLNPRIDWKESLYLATKGGAEAMGLPQGSGWFNVGAPFDAQQSVSILYNGSSANTDVHPYSPPLQSNDRGGCWCA